EAAMERSNSGHEPGDLGYGAWFAFWAPLLLLGLVAIIGAFFASADRSPGDYACGLLLSLAALALAFLRVKSRFDGGPADWAGFLLVDDITNMVAVIVVFTLLGLAGLFIAAGNPEGGL